MKFLAMFRAAAVGLFAVLTLAANAAEFSGQCRVIFDPALKPEDARRISETGKFPAGSRVHEFRLDADGTFPLEKLCGKFTPMTDAAAVLFTVTADREELTSLGMGSDWWHSCFVNGVEIGSSEPSGNGVWPPTPDNFRWRLPLRKGENFVAVHLRPGVGSWRFACKVKPVPDVSAWPKEEKARRALYELLFPLRREIRRGPVVSRVSRDRATVSVEFAAPVCAGLVLRKEGKGEGKVVYDPVYGRAPVVAVHRFELAGLEPATRYTYEIFSHHPKSGAKEPAGGGAFTTFPATGGSVTFSLASDLQLAEERRREVMRGFCEKTDLLRQDFFVSLGDTASDIHDFGCVYFDSCLDVLLKEKKSELPFVPVRGNHEYRGADTERFGELFGRPYGTFRYGDIFFFVLDTGDQQARRPDYDYWRTDLGGYLREQAEFLKRAAASEECRSAKYRVVLAHLVPFEWEAANYAPDVAMLAKELFFGDSPRCPIDLWLCAHVHIPYRYDPVRRELAGVPRRPTAKKSLKMTPADLANVRFPVFVNDGPRGPRRDQASLTRVEMRDGVLTVSCITPEGKVLDKVKFRRGEPFEVVETTYVPYPR